MKNPFSVVVSLFLRPTTSRGRWRAMLLCILILMALGASLILSQGREGGKGEQLSVVPESFILSTKRPVLGPLFLLGADGTPAPDPLDGASNVTLLHFWASWCAPCVRELPALDRLMGMLEGDQVRIFPIAVEADARAVDSMLKRLQTNRIGRLRDPKLGVMRDLRVRRLPTTILVDADRHEIGRFDGEVDWSRPDIALWLRAPESFR